MKELGELEHKIMHVVWREPGVSVREVCDLLQDDKQRAYTTVMTTLDRLHRKGHVSREKDGLAWRYRGTRTGEEFRQALADHLAAEILRAHRELGVAAFVDAASEDQELLDRLIELVEKRRSDP